MELRSVSQEVTLDQASVDLLGEDLMSTRKEQLGKSFIPQLYGGSGSDLRVTTRPQALAFQVTPKKSSFRHCTTMYDAKTADTLTEHLAVSAENEPCADLPASKGFSPILVCY